MLYNVQALRFLAAAAVAASHIADRLVPPDPATAWFWSVPWTAGVDLFFVISGFMMLLLTRDAFGRPHEAARFLRRRVARIVPAYWLFSAVIVVAVLVAGGRLKGTTASVDQIVTSFAFIPWPRSDGKLNPVLAQGWTLNYEAFFYLAFAAAMVSRRGLVALCAAFCALAATHSLWPERLFMLRFWSDPIILEFLAGVGLAKLYLTGRRLSRIAASFVAASAVVAFVALRDVPLGDYDRVVHAGVPALLIGASVILSREPESLGPVRRLIRRGGDASYSLYLSHYIIINVVALLWVRSSLPLPWLGVAIGLAASFCFAFLFYHYLERRMTDRMRHWLEPGSRSGAV